MAIIIFESDFARRIYGEAVEAAKNGQPIPTYEECIAKVSVPPRQENVSADWDEDGVVVGSLSYWARQPE